jgi:nitroimidazol reductase NimA-like FMN-containing flavoprotein (pyridoxamine 5'-phosphate oxidase superfamily)
METCDCSRLIDGGVLLLKVDAMSLGESQALLLRVGYGHLGCARDNHPYVVPMHYAYDSEYLYFFTTEGTKTEYIAANSEVCFQVEEVTDASYWRSVMVIGHAERITRDAELQSAIALIKERNPTLTPAINETHIGPWKRLSKMAVYRLHPETLYGRKTI